MRVQGGGKGRLALLRERKKGGGGKIKKACPKGVFAKISCRQGKGSSIGN